MQRIFHALFICFLLSGCLLRRDQNAQSLDRTIETRVEYLANKPLNVVNTYAWKCLSDETQARSQSCFKGRHNFELKRTDSNAFTLVSQESGKCLALESASLVSGTSVVFKNCVDNDPEQRFQLKQSVNDPLYMNLVFTYSNMCLDSNKHRSSGSQFHQWVCLGAQARSQDFYFLDTTMKPKRDLPRIVWTYWDKGESAMPAFYKANVSRWREILGKSSSPQRNWEVRVINKIPGDANNYGKFIDPAKLPTIEYFQAKIDPTETKLNPQVILSDFIRMELLLEKGGVWMDPSIILHKDLEELADLLERMVPHTILGFTSYEQATRELKYADSLENFFLMSLPQTELFKQWRVSFHQFWVQKQPGMSSENHPMFNGTTGPKIDVVNSYGVFRNYLNQHISLKYTLTNQRSLLDEVYVLGGVQSDENGPFTLLQQAEWVDRNLVEMSRQAQKNILNRMREVLMSKFPSENSRYIREKGTTESYFLNTNNIFGLLNTLPYQN